MTASESSGSVCLLEAGPSDIGDDNILRLNRWLGLLGSGHAWDYPVEPQEKGNSFLRHARPKARVDPRYFTDPYDIDIMTRGLPLARKITARPALALRAGAELAPGPDVHSNDELAAYIRETHNTVYHPACTVPMGAPDDPEPRSIRG
ncbi:hypothetical protein GCM10010390_28490 [Streptomyces mordarskii]|uniref:Glucose-methanol-choline oxidoreductase C-terminal domain-containing protein n=1 Tax=Streptomyces mordarskii TaxID=1226758 RepID=A0ABN1CSZ7_9ACTN